MEMHQIRYFLAVARSLNFTRAAEQCHVAQPSLTRAIQKLEDELGGLLLHRERQSAYTESWSPAGTPATPNAAACFLDYRRKREMRAQRAQS